jgi:hypothetical protein
MKQIYRVEKRGLAYWSDNVTFTVMTPQRQPFGPAEGQVPDRELLTTLLGSRGAAEINQRGLG